jgi:hypothetical protein
MKLKSLLPIHILKEERAIDLSKISLDPHARVFDNLKKLAPNLDIETLKIGGLDPDAGPDDGTAEAYIESAMDKSGKPLSDQELDRLSDRYEAQEDIIAIAIEYFGDINA